MKSAARLIEEESTTSAPRGRGSLELVGGDRSAEVEALSVAEADLPARLRLPFRLDPLRDRLHPQVVRDSHERAQEPAAVRQVGLVDPGHETAGEPSEGGGRLVKVGQGGAGRAGDVVGPEGGA